MIVGATGLLLTLNAAERARMLAVLRGIGANARQVGAFVRSDGVFVVLGGALLGAGTGVLVAWLLVRDLTGVFDPPPEALSAPAGYLAVAGALAVVATAVAVAAASRRVGRHVTEALREL